MDRSEILSKLQNIFREFFNNPELAVTEDTVSENMEEWDSVAHIQLIYEIEEQFDIQFEADDIHRMDSIHALIGKIIEISE
jgi:acyl carrier protein